jgi:hypothetical protein
VCNISWISTFGDARAHTVSRRLLTARDRDQFHAILCGLCGGQSGTGTGFSLNEFGIPCNNYSPNPPSYLVLAVGFFSNQLDLTFLEFIKVFTATALLAETKLHFGLLRFPRYFNHPLTMSSIAYKVLTVILFHQIPYTLGFLPVVHIQVVLDL